MQRGRHRGTVPRKHLRPRCCYIASFAFLKNLFTKYTCPLPVTLEVIVVCITPLLPLRVPFLQFKQPHFNIPLIGNVVPFALCSEVTVFT